MVNKLWCRELARRWFQAKYEPPRGRCFSEPRCQEHLESWYLFYRWLICLLWSTIVVCSILEIGSVQPMGYWEKWPIYLTNWDLALGLLQSLLGAILVTRRWRYQKNCLDFDANTHLEYGKLEKVYWFLYVVTSSLALGVTGTYWGLVHDPKIHHVDLLNVMIHVSNSILMLIDLFVAGIPFELRSFWWSPLLVTNYLLFTVVYYLAGGLDKRGQHRIYNVLDWKKPGRTLIVCVGGISFLVITHCLLYFLARFRDRFYDKRRKSTTPIKQQQQPQQQPADRRKCDSFV